MEILDIFDGEKRDKRGSSDIVYTILTVARDNDLDKTKLITKAKLISYQVNKYLLTMINYQLLEFVPDPSNQVKNRHKKPEKKNLSKLLQKGYTF